ncbi:MAG: radical SAM family heme chaperone HemW [Acidobacteria bacterium]|nr:radical SAM family heme chaperone HemW [Acidobacteriota bacterium]
MHIPFCPYQCIYCDFDAGVYPKRMMSEYVEALLTEISFTRAQFYPESLTADTIYFGGGTPSLLAVDQLEKILHGVRQRFTILENDEITIEANPESISHEKARQLGQIGVNRISVGVQSFMDQELRMLGRGHTAHDVGASFAILREAGFNNLNLDLIGGLPGQSMENWLYNLDQAFALRPEHLSMYLLEVHETTMLAELLKRGRLPQPDDELSVEMYYALLDRAEAEGYEHYELSNYCLPGFHSRHNMKYWSDVPYLGFGCSAASYDGRERRVNVSTPGQYIDCINHSGQAVVTRTLVTPETRRQEALFLGLRRIEGIDLEQFQTRYGIDVWAEYAIELQPLLEAKLVARENGCLKLTRKGLTVSNEVFKVFV